MGCFWCYSFSKIPIGTSEVEVASNQNKGILKISCKSSSNNWRKLSNLFGVYDGDQYKEITWTFFLFLIDFTNTLVYLCKMDS